MSVPSDRLEKARKVVARLMQGEIVSPEAPDLSQRALFSEDVVYTNVRGIARAEPDWYRALLSNHCYPRRLRMILRQSGTPGYCGLTDAFRFEREDWSWWRIKQRICVNSELKSTLTLIRHLVREVLNKAGAFPGVEMIRVAGPRTLPNKVDRIVIFTSGGEATERVLQVLAECQDAQPSFFLEGVPQMIQPVMRGVGIGSEPLGPRAGLDSFATLRLNLITRAMNEVSQEGWQGQDQAEWNYCRLSEAVNLLFVRAGIDPVRPHLNLFGPEPPPARGAVTHYRLRRGLSPAALKIDQFPPQAQILTRPPALPMVRDLAARHRREEGLTRVRRVEVLERYFGQRWGHYPWSELICAVYDDGTLRAWEAGQDPDWGQEASTLELSRESLNRLLRDLLLDICPAGLARWSA